MYNEGISLPGDLLDVGVTYKVIGKSGNTYSFGEEKLGVGRENVKTYLRSRPDLMSAIRSQVWSIVHAPGGIPVSALSGEEAPFPEMEEEVPA